MTLWIGVCELRLAPLVGALKELILSQRVIHADETPVALLAPGKGKAKNAYVWVYRTTNFSAQRAVYYDFCKDRWGEYPRRVLHAFTGTLVSDDYAGYLAKSRLASARRSGRLLHHGPRPAQVVRGARAQRQRSRRPGRRAHRQTLRDRARGARTRPRRAQVTATAALQAHRRRAAGATPL